ncbi:MAG: hypothetical protein ACSHX3_13140 [Litorimonas sp.]
MKKSVICLLLAASMFYATSASAQESYPQRTTIQKENGAFLGYIGQDAVSGGDEISRLELGVKWVGLLGQPVEDYQLRWLNNGFYYLPGGATKLNRYQLEQHPDLLARYDNIRPSSLILSMSVTADEADKPTPTPHHYSGMSGFNDSASGTKYVRSTPHMVVLRAGCRSSNLIASSPPKNRDFIDWERGMSSGDPDQSAQNTLAGAKQIRLSSLRVDSVEWPMTRIQAIYDEYQDRTNVPEDTVAAAAKAELDSFWGNDRPGVDGKRMRDSIALTPCPEERILVANEISKIEDDGGIYDGEITRYKSRVVTVSGREIVPWVEKKITRFENGTGQAYKPVRSHSYECKNNIFGAINGLVVEYDFGTIDATGAWVGNPERYGRAENAASCGTWWIERGEEKARGMGLKVMGYDEFSRRTAVIQPPQP